MTLIIILSLAAIGLYLLARWLDSNGFCAGCEYQESGNIQSCIWHCPREEEGEDG